jgi:cytochrome c
MLTAMARSNYRFCNSQAGTSRLDKAMAAYMQWLEQQTTGQ